MTEVEILSEMTTHGDRIWSILQYWTGVCFGILVAAHLTAWRVSLIVIAVFLTVFSLFTLQLVNMLTYDMGVIRAGAVELASMADKGADLGSIARTVLSSSPAVSNDPYAIFLRYSVLPAMFIVTLAYPIYCYFKSGSD